MKAQPTVKVSSARPADWAVRKSEAMHDKLANGADKQAARAEDREAAADERRGYRTEHKPGRRRQKIQTYRAA